MLLIVYLWFEVTPLMTKVRLISARRATSAEISQYEKQPMSDTRTVDDDMRPEIDFSNGVRGLHHIPPDAKVFVPASIERGVWEYFSDKTERRGVEVSELLTEALKRDIEINEALK